MIKVYYKILQFLDTTESNDVNYFNPSEIFIATSKSELTDVISVSGIRYDRGIVINSGNTLELIRKCGDIDIEIGTNNTHVTNFNIKTGNHKTIYLFYIRSNDETIFTGVATQDNITYTEAPEPSAERIKIKVASLLNHFLTYYSNILCSLSEVETVFNRGLHTGGNYRSAYLENFLRRLFFNDRYDSYVFNETGFDWEVNREPLFFMSSTYKYFFVSNGFRKSTNEFINKKDFFMWMCNSMGWDFTLSLDFDSEFLSLSIYNRYRDEEIKTIEYNKFASINYQTKYELSNIDYIAIKDGRIKGGNSYKGTSNIGDVTPDGYPIKLITTDTTYSNKGCFFGRAVKSGSRYVLYPHENPLYYMTGNVFGSGDILDWVNVVYTYPDRWVRVITRNKFYNKNILYIEGGECQTGTICDMLTGYLSPDATDIGTSSYDVYFTGNYGSMLFTRDSNNDLVYNYDFYSQSETFKNNFLMLLNNKDYDVIEINYNELLTDYYDSNYNIVNITPPNDSSDYYFFQGDWIIANMELDTVNETTKLILKRSNI